MITILCILKTFHKMEEIKKIYKVITGYKSEGANTEKKEAGHKELYECVFQALGPRVFK
jgi:hypothetical protein